MDGYFSVVYGTFTVKFTVTTTSCRFQKIPWDCFLLKTIVNDISKFIYLAMVDPGHITIPLCNDPELLGRQHGYCK